MATCQGTPTATQFTTTVSSSFSERTVYSTTFETIGGGFFLRPRQDPTDSASTPSPTIPPSTSSSIGGTFSIQEEVRTIIQTTTLTDTLFFTATIPVLTLYDSCSTSDSSTATRSSTASLTSTTSSASIHPDIITDMDLTTVPPDGKATTTSGGMTIVISEFVTTINGVETIFATPIQTLLNTSDGFLNHSQRTGVIAGAAVGGVFVLVALLGLLFYFRRTRQVRQRHLEEKRAKERPPRHLLEDEADDFHFGGRGPPMMAQHWDSTSFTSGGSSPSAPRLLRARGSRTGSLFQEDVWPPPNEVMQDPLLTAHDLGSSISLAMGVPHDGSTSSQADVSQPEFKQPSLTQPISSADAYAFGVAPAGVGHSAQRSSAYDSIRSADSADYYYNGRSHSRAESSEPLLDDTGRGSVSPPPVTARNLTASPTNTMDRRTRKSNLRMSYTADDFQPGSSSSLPRTGHLRAGTGNSAGSLSSPAASPEDVTGRAEELPPMYHTIPRDAS